MEQGTYEMQVTAVYNSTRWLKRLAAISTTAICATMFMGTGAANAFVAYIVPGGQAGNQSFGGSLGMDFDVNTAIDITHLARIIHGRHMV